jgi:glucosamine--fructose-6-phosphate aminotransferase (isomerizing)
MCGIIAYTGHRVALPLLINGLTKLEYRGYDSAGTYTDDGLFRAVGKVANLAACVPKDAHGHTGIAHTRWATHGPPEEVNAHPHTSKGKTLYLVHNGIIENYKELRDELKKKGHTFTSQTDSEVLAHIIGDERERTEDNATALAKALTRVRGTYGIAVMFTDEPETLYAAALGSPIALGIGDHEMWIASDASAVIQETKRIVYLEDGEYAVVTPDTYTVRSLTHESHTREPVTLDIDASAVEKQGYAHFMLKEMHEIPSIIEDTTRGRLKPGGVTVKLGGLDEVTRELADMKRLSIVGCGSAYYAGLYGKYLIEDVVGIPVDMVLGSEGRYANPILSSNDVLLAVSQSGETADTLASIKSAKERGVLTLGLINVVGSTIARTVDAGVYTHAGPEIGVASTKAYIAQLISFGLIALWLGKERGVSPVRLSRLATALQTAPRLVESVLARADDIRRVAEKYAHHSHMLFLGRKYNVSTAHEGALKLKEVSYIHAEGYPAGEMKHGPLAMIDKNFPVLAIAPKDSVYEKMVSNIEEIKARGGPVIMLATDGDSGAKELATDAIWLPECAEEMTPVATAVTLQLFAYYAGVALGHDVDRPRNLAKSVTVE